MRDGHGLSVPHVAVEARGALGRMAEWVLRHPLVVCLPIQAVLLFSNLVHLPVWGDEQASLNRAALPLRALERALAANVHPPLYFLLLRSWLALPWSGDPIVAARALSAVLLLIATVVVDRCWLRPLDARSRAGFLALWALSPVLLLYGRMARSYTLQMLLASVTLHAGRRYGARFSTANLLTYAAAATGLLYTHYLPGVAVLTAVSLVTARPLLGRRGETAQMLYVLAPVAIVGIAFAVWSPNFVAALGRVSSATPYRVLGSEWLAAVAGLGYTYVAFTAGECLHLWMVPVLMLLTPVLGVLLVRGVRVAPDWLGMVLIAAIIALVGARQWVAYAFVAPRLLFLFPFYLLLLGYGARALPRARGVVFAVLLVLSVGGVQAYFTGIGFLNKAYVIPTADISRAIRDGSGELPAVVILDHHSTSLRAIADRLPSGARTIMVADRASAEQAARVAREDGVEVVWFVRNAHDGSLEQWNERIERAFAPTFNIRRSFFAPYSRLDRLMMALAGWPERPTHVIELLEMHRQR